MRRIISALLLSSCFIADSVAQEQFVDSISKRKHLGLVSGGDMGQIYYFPYFNNSKTDKHNFVVRTYGGPTLLEEQSMRLELPTSYRLDASAFNGQSFLFIFFDEAKKEDVFISVVQGNIYKKKSVKHSGATYKTFVVPGENFVVMTIENKGDYNIQMLNNDLEAKWKKDFPAAKGVTTDIVSIMAKMDAIQVLKKESESNGRYTFSMQSVQTFEGTELGNNKLITDSVRPYPVMMIENEGLTASAGFYYQNGTFSAAPLGAFCAIISPEGRIEQMFTVPYSQVVEDVKATLGDKLTNANSTLTLSGFLMSHEKQQYFITGQVITKTPEEGGAVIETGDFVTMKFTFEGAYKGATVTKNVHGPQKIKLKGDLSKINMPDLGMWMKNAGLLQFSHFVFMPAANPVFAYTSPINNQFNICISNAGLAKDTLDPVCMPVLMENISDNQTYKYTPGIPSYLPAQKILINPHEQARIGTIQFTEDRMVLRKIDLPDIQHIRIEAMPEQPEEAPPVEEQPEENNN